MPDSRPNILWICTDQQRYDTIHSLGNQAIRTPNLDRLVREGVAFTRAYCQCPVCTPSRASFLTGRYPSSIHVNRNGNAFFPADVPLFPRMLADQGYDCGLVGKLHLSAADGRVEQRPDDGYRVFKWSHHPKPESFWPTEQHAYQQWLESNGVHWQNAYRAAPSSGWARQSAYQAGMPAEYHQTTWCANEAISFMLEERDCPWLMSVNPFDPHPPFDPPPEYLERMNVEGMPLPLFRPEELQSQLAFGEVDHQTTQPRSPHEYDARQMVATYYAQIELLDDQVGRMLNALEQSGQRENTIVIYASDHGDMLGDHGLELKGCRFYEGAVRVPLIISWPRSFEQEVRSEALVELTDLVPTLLEALGQEPAPEMHGVSLYRLLCGSTPANEHRAFVRCEYHDALLRPNASHANMLYDGKHKLVVYHGLDIGELYDLEMDPCEFVNLWDATEAQNTKHRLIKQLFDATMLATDEGQPRVGRY